jgi:hypothetical protein
VLGVAVEPGELVSDPVEALQHRLELGSGISFASMARI